MKEVVVVAPLLLEAPLQSGREVVRRVRRRLGAEEVEGHAEVEVQVPLQRRGVDAAEGADVVGVVLLHELDGALHHSTDASGADEHVVRLLLQHEVARPRQRVERALPKRRELELAVAIGEVGEEVEREPVGCRLVERAEDARVVGVARVPLEELVGFVTAVTTEVPVEQVHHRPEMASLLDVHLEQVAHVVEARSGEAEVALLLDRRRLGVALDDEQAPELGTMLARNVVPNGLALASPKAIARSGSGVGEEDAPAVVGHADVVEVRPALLADRDRGAQEDVVLS